MCKPDGATIETVDKSGKCLECSYEFAHGPIRDALKAIDTLKERNTSRFNWTDSSDALHLSEHDHLIPLLVRTGKLVNQHMKPITLDNTTAKVQLNLNETEATYESCLLLHSNDDTHSSFSLISEAYTLVNENHIIPIEPIGPHFADLHLFETSFAKEQLEPFLTLLFSTLDQVTPTLENFRITTGSPQQTTPCVIFEDVDSDGCLKLRVASALSGFEPEFLENYDVNRAATVNSLEKTIVVSDIIHEATAQCIQLIARSLKKLDRKAAGTFFQDDTFFLIDSDLVEPFLSDTLPILLTQYQCYGADHLQRFKLRTTRPKLKISSVSSGIDFLQTDAILEIDDQTVSLAEALKLFRKHTYIPLNDGSKALVNSQYIRRLERLFKTKGKTASISFFDLPFLDDLIEENDLRKVENLTSASDIFTQLNTSKAAPKPKIKAKLRPYQKEGYEWMHRLNTAGLGGCLADDMGLGKTVQTLALLQATTKKKTPPSLVVMPRSLLFNWLTEIAKFSPDLTSVIYHGTGRDLKAALDSNLILTTYGTLRSDIETLQDIGFHYLILDESQNIKNPNAQATKAVQLIKSKHRLALSGTPVENNLTELYSLFRVLNPSMFSSLQAFNSDYAIPISKDNDKQAMADLQRKIAPFMLRRTKKQVLKDLPDKVEQVLYVDMSDEQAALYENRRRFYSDIVTSSIATEGIQNSQFILLQAFTELRQIASTPESKSDLPIISPKSDLVIQEIQEATANGHKCLVFANFLNALDTISDGLNAASLPHLLMTGATRDREALVKRFQNDDSVKVFLMTLKTGGVGLNLTAADYVFIYDPWWNRAAENQAVDRTHRIGQKNTVFTYKLVARNTIEEKILRLQQMKGELFDNLIGADGACLKSLTVDDVRFALGDSQ